MERASKHALIEAVRHHGLVGGEAHLPAGVGEGHGLALHHVGTQDSAGRQIAQDLRGFVRRSPHVGTVIDGFLQVLQKGGGGGGEEEEGGRRKRGRRGGGKEEEEEER